MQLWTITAGVILVFRVLKSLLEQSENFRHVLFYYYSLQ